MPKQKVTAEPVLKSYYEVDDALLEIAQIDGRVARSEALVNEQIQAWKDQLVDETDDDLARKERLAKDLQEFCEFHKDEFTGKRSRELNHGTVGFRLSTALAALGKHTWASVLDLLKAAQRTSFIRVKEEIDKEAVRSADLPADELAAIGMQMKEKDEFYFEATAVKAKSTA
jgi:phage host-nuclease inhibitor protein Gam